MSVKSASVKSKIYRALVNVDGQTRDYSVQAYDKEDVIPALAKKLNISESSISHGRAYSLQELQVMWKDNSKIFVRDYETTKTEDFQLRKLQERAQSDLYALLRNEAPKCISDGDLYIIKEKNQDRELRMRPFFCTIGQRSNGEPIKITSSGNRERKFYTDTNDVIYDHEDTILVRNTGYIFPESVAGSKKQEDLDKVFRFACLQDAYHFVRQSIIDCGIADKPSRKNGDLTYLEHCDSWLAGTGVKMGEKEASEKVVTKYMKDMAKVKNEDGTLKYPKFGGKKK